jgi:UDP-N-acetylmuramoyl-tripeptide--D-alanyl-D-alanine ligase
MSQLWMMQSQLQKFLPGSQIVNALANDFPIKRFISNSRDILPGDCFIAIRGEKFDAHDFLNDVQAQGASAALISDVEKLPKNLPGILVRDTVEGLQDLAQAWKKVCAGQNLRKLAVVTGSNGKTTVKGMIESIFSAGVGIQHALATQGNLNNEIGLPLTLLRLTAEHQLAVIELGMNHPGETKLLADIAQANIALINNAQREHQEFMATVDAVAQEHGLAISALPSDGVAVFPADSKYSSYWRELSGARAVIDFAWGKNAQAAVTGTWVDQASNRISIHCPQGSMELQLNILGEHNACNALAATAVGLAAGLALDDIKKGLINFQPVNGRMQIHQLNKNTTLIDDTYNANPDSVRAAIDVLSSMGNSAWLVLGDMGEVGDQGPQFHAEIGMYAKEKDIKKLFATGDLSKEAVLAYNQKITDGKDSAIHATHFEKFDDLCSELKGLLQKRSDKEQVTLLIKGSRFMRMERAVKALAEEIH